VEIPTTPLGIASLILLGLGTAAKGLWNYIRSREERCQAEKDQLRAELNQARAELRAEQQDHLKTLRVYAALQAKHERERADSSSPPPNS
jgi:predicted nuclease with TOPRIM domain